jgi:replicative DNA helicase
MTIGGGARLTTGYSELDKLLLDLSSHRLIVIGGRPGMGKTGLLLGLVVHTIISRIPAGLVTLDAAQGELVERLLAIQARLDLKRMVRGVFTDPEYERVAGALGPLGDAPLAIAEGVGMEVSQIAETMRNMKQQLGIRLLFVDGYDNVYQAAGGSPARALRAIARGSEIPMIVTAEVSRAVEERPDRRPLRTDLADPPLESEADSIVFVYRSAYYGPSSEMEAKGELIVVKNRLGTRGVVELTWDHATASFRTMRSIETEE